MKNKRGCTPYHLVKNRWFHLGFSITLAFVLALVLLFLPIRVGTVIRIPAPTLPQHELVSGSHSSKLDDSGKTIDLPLPFGIALVQAAGGLTVTKSAPLTVTVGGTLTYTLTITNGTGEDLTNSNFLAYDETPNGTSCLSTQHPPGWNSSCGTELDPTTAWGLNSESVFTKNTTAILIFTVRVSSPLPDQFKIINNDYGAYKNLDLTPGPTFTTTVYAPTWEISKTASSNTVQPNQILVYTITVTNTGNMDTSGTYTITDTIPTSTTLVEAPEAVSTSPPTWTFSDPLAKLGGSRSVTFSVRVDSPLPGGTKIVNDSYSVSGDNVYSAAAGNPITVTVDSPVTLSIAKIADPDPVRVNDLLTYTLTVTNNAAIGPAEGVVITETLPGDVTYQSAGFVGGASGTITPTGNTVVWSLNGTIPANNAVQVTVTARVNGMTLPDPAWITNTTYSASASNAPLVSGSPLATELKAGQPNAITVTVGSTALQVCQTTSVTATLVDQWNNRVSDESVTLSVTDLGSGADGRLSSALGNTNAAGIFTTTLTATDAGPSPPNNAYVLGWWTGHFDDVKDFSDPISINDPPVPDQLTLDVSPNPLAAGGARAVVTGTLVYCPEATKSGKTITFTLSSTGPAAFAGPAASDTGITDANGAATAVLTSTVAAISSTLTITGTGEGLTGTTTLNVHTPVLTITKTAAPSGQVNAGGTINYTIGVDNVGDVEAFNVSLTDTLPLSVSYVSLISSTNASGAISDPSFPGSNVVVLSISKLEAGKTLTATI
jgi:uncharacterized repeat protein (TIGR01451 family)